MVKSLKHYGSGGERLSCPHGAAKSFPVGTVKPVKVGDINCSECPCYNGIDPKSIDKRENYATMCCYPDFAPNNRMRTMDEERKTNDEERRTMAEWSQRDLNLEYAAKQKEEPKAEPSGTVAKEAKEG